MTNKIDLKIEIPKLENEIDACSSKEKCHLILSRINDIQESLEDREKARLFLKAWRIAFEIGKVKIAEEFLEFSFKFLLREKRILRIELLLNQIRETGLCKNRIPAIDEMLKILKGEASFTIQSDDDCFEIFLAHPRWWKNQKKFISYYLSTELDWELEDWKIIYEIALKGNLTIEILKALYNKSLKHKKAEFSGEFEKYFKDKNIQNKKEENKIAKKKSTKKTEVNLDQVALEHFMGDVVSVEEDEKRVIAELKFSTKEEIKEKGKEMAIALQTLGMTNACLYLCDQLIDLTNEVKRRAEINFIKAQACLEGNKYFMVVDLVDELISTEPLTEEEVIAFRYLKAEALFFQHKTKEAKNIYADISKRNKNYRLTKDRLKLLEANK